MKTEIIQINPKEPEVEKIKKVAKVLREGGLVVIPTETVYGIAADMLNKSTIQRLYTVKQRSPNKPFSLLISSKEDVEKYARDILPAAWRLMERLWPGPITLILKSKDNGKVGIRMPNHRIALSIIREANVAVVCPSANVSGNLAPHTAEEVLKDLNGLVDLVLDAGETPLGIESTVVDVTELPIQFLRKGALSEEEIEKVVNKEIILFVCTGNSCRSVMAKALLEKKLKEKNREDIEVLSSGIMMWPGLGATIETEELLRKEGIDVSGHHSQKVTKDLLNKSDLILVMERFHEEKILQLAPEVKNRLFLLKEFANPVRNTHINSLVKISNGTKINNKDNLDITDPIGKSREFYASTFVIIKEAIERISDIL